MTPEESAAQLSEHVDAQDIEIDETADLAHSLIIQCPDCGRQIAFRGRCPKCGGASWVPAGHAGGVAERLRAREEKDKEKDG